MNKKEERAKLLAEMKEMNEKAANEKRSFSEDEKKVFAEKEKRFRVLSAEIEAEEREQKLNGFTDTLPKAGEDKPKTAERKGFFRTEKRGGDTFLSLGTGDAPGSAYSLAPEEFVEEILSEVEKEAILYGRVRKISVSGAGSLGVPYEKADASAAEWTNEIPATEITSDKSLEYGKRELAPTDLVKQFTVTKKLLATSAFPIDTIAKGKIIEKLTESFENGILNGTGENQPLGIFTKSDDGIPASRDVATAGDSISADDLVNLKMKLRPAYRNKACWVMSTEILKDIMLLKDQNGRFLWQPALTEGQPSTILGLPVIESEYAPNAKTAGSYVVALGDFSHYWFAHWKDMDITVLNEKFAGTNQIGFLGHTLADGQPTLPAAFARLAIKA